MRIILQIVIFGAPLWIPAVLIFFSPRLALCLFVLSLIACVGACGFAMGHAGDRGGVHLKS